MNITENEKRALNAKLHSIGKSAFLNLFPLVKNNLDITIEEIERKYPKYKTYTPDAKRTRLSSTRSIIINGQGTDALRLIAESSRLDTMECQMAKSMLDAYLQ